MVLVEGLGEIKVELRSHDARLTANHDSIGRLRERTAAHDTAIKVIMGEVKEAREDVTGMNSRLERLDERMVQRFDKLGRNFYVAIAASCGLMVSICGVMVTILTR